MPYEKVVLTDGMEVLFAVSDEPQETESSEAETPQRDIRVLVAAITAESRVTAAGKAPRVESGSACGVAGRGTRAPTPSRMPGIVERMTHRSQTSSPEES